MWRAVSADDVISVPAGTIHAIGAGLVIAEIQQRSDATFRLFDHGRQRELHVESAIAVADAGPGRSPGAAEPAHRRADTSCLQPALRVRKDRSAAKLRLVPGSGSGDLASRCRRRCPHRVVRRCHRRRHFRAVGPRQHCAGAHSAWWASSRTRAATRFRTCCSASSRRSATQTTAGVQRADSSREQGRPTNGRLETTNESYFSVWRSSAIIFRAAAE